MYDHTLHRARKYFCCYFLQAFSIEEILKCHINDFLKINVKQMIQMPKKAGYVQFKNYIKKLMIYAVFERILMPEDNGKQNPEESYAKKYQKYVACSYGYKLVCVDDKVSKSFKYYLGEDATYNFINNIVEESKNCTDIIKKK